MRRELQHNTDSVVITSMQKYARQRAGRRKTKRRVTLFIVFLILIVGAILFLVFAGGKSDGDINSDAYADAVQNGYLILKLIFHF